MPTAAVPLEPVVAIMRALLSDRRVRLLLGPLAALLLYAVLPTYMRYGDSVWLIRDGYMPAGAEALPVREVAAIAAWMAIWWLTEAIPMAATALLPLVLLPLIGVSPLADAAAPYANPLIFLFLGGFLLGAAMQRWNLHRRLALRTLLIVGTSPRRMVLGFMVATALLSMWISNTATVVMMVPIALSVVALVESHRRENEAESGSDAAGDGSGGTGSLAVPLLLGTAYGASIGGIATLIGTPPNAMLASIMLESHDIEIGFLEWMQFGLPISIVILPIAWWLLVGWLYPVRGAAIEGGREMLQRELAELGPMSRAEKRVLIVFGLAAVAWVLRSVLPNLLGEEAAASATVVAFASLGDGGIAIAAALILFALPSGEKGQPVLDWNVAQRSTPWGVLVLFGGGLSLANAMTNSGLASLIGQSIGNVGGVDVALLIGLIALVVVFLTEVTSNTATTSALVPVLASVAVLNGMSPMTLALPAAVAASLAFMLPVATPPNAIVFGSGHLRIPQMARAGLVLNLIGTVVITLAVLSLASGVFGIELASSGS